MSTLTGPQPTDPKELRPLLHAELDRLPDEHLETAHRFLLEMEVQHALESLGTATEQAWSRGDLSDEKIAETVREHRQRHCGSLEHGRRVILHVLFFAQLMVHSIP
ncbi:hypothetical protein [Prosthecobacter sp.]|uniref:hypothetical protein n=1 Tax=Prosthecobacter sp. TaxID=1965333 RepID=UPI002489A2DA|nr:hypothetical protein [Prosthecobacter sp.]MDI1314951.1 hypothetical protein [Prosthecobacter sp.]